MCKVCAMIMKEETDRIDSILKAGLLLGRTVDIELYAQYVWKRHTNWKTRPPQGLYLDSPRCLKEYPDYLCI